MAPGVAQARAGGLSPTSQQPVTLTTGYEKCCVPSGATMFSKLGVQFLGLGYCIE